MTKDEEDALYEEFDNDRHSVIGTRGAFLVAIRAAVAQERERAARVCEGMYPKAHTMASENSSFYSAQDQVVRDCAAAIRRGP